MVDCWTNFAKYGDPNGKGKEKWMPCTEENNQFMLFTTDERKNTSSMGQPVGPEAD